MKIRALSILFLLLSIAVIAKEGSEVNTETLTYEESLDDVTSKLNNKELIMTFEDHVRGIYDSIQLEQHGLPFDAFLTGYTGYFNLKDQGALMSEDLLTILDFSKSANEERMFIIDLKHYQLAYKILVAHGQGTGEEFAYNFSNEPKSHASSMGFFVTGKTYEGGRGYSLKLHGMEPGINDKVYERGVVIHGADYVSYDFIQNNGRLGRSFGCPAVQEDLNADVCDLLANKSCLYIYYPDANYFKYSDLVYQHFDWEGDYSDFAAK